MNTNWWRNLSELNQDQRDFILLPPHGKHLLEGPPGSGKTNLLLLRAEFTAGQGSKNVLVITFTRSLTNFIRSGIGAKKLISPDQVKTYHSWALDHIYQHLGKQTIPQNYKFDDNTRAAILEGLTEANKNLPTPKIYDAIFVDEAQDFTTAELEALLCLSDNICICGDNRQGIYNKNGLSIAETFGLQKHTLKQHFRIGQRIARVADRLLPPEDGCESLEATSNYNPKIQGESSANLHSCESRNAQFELMLSLIKVQLDAFNDDSIGILCGTRETRKELDQRLKATDLKSLVCTHGIDGDADFANRTIHILTIYGAKGTEFRAVHMYGTEELNVGALRRTKLSYTAVTRAKTALNAYKTGGTTKALESAFSEPTLFDLADLFEDVK